MSEKLHLKPSPLNFCFSCGHFEWSHDQFTTILSLRPKLAKNGRKVPQMTEIGLNVWKVTSETISIGFLLLLWSFWVVTWLVCNNFEFGAKIGQKWPKSAPNDRNWPECLKSYIRNHLHWISASLAVVLSGHMTSLRQFWVLGHKLAQNGPKMAPKWPRNCPKWPQWVQSDFRNHLHQNSAPLAIVLSGHMTSLWQFWVGGHKLARNGPKMAPKWPQMTSSLQSDFWNHLHRNSAPLAVILSGHMTSLRQI